MTLRDDDVLEVFIALPGHDGCTAEELDRIERQFSITLPPQYRTMMQLDARRLANAGIVTPLHDLSGQRDDANSILIDDRYSFRLAPTDFVFAWDDIIAFYFFRADGTPDPPVMRFNYYSLADGGKPTVAHDTLTAYFTNAIRHYLKL